MKSLKKATLGDTAALLPVPNALTALQIGEFLSAGLRGINMPDSARPSQNPARQRSIHPRTIGKTFAGAAGRFARVCEEIRSLWRGCDGLAEALIQGPAGKLRRAETKPRSASPEFGDERQALLARVALLEQKLATAESLIARSADWMPLVKAVRASAAGHASDCHASAGMKTGCRGGDGCALAGRSVLCVGGRAALYPEYRRLVQAAGGNLTIYRGGMQDSLERLSALLAASDLVICPVDCVSHHAYFAVKRYCNRSGKPCALLDRSGLATFRTGMNTLAALPSPERKLP